VAKTVGSVICYKVALEEGGIEGGVRSEGWVGEPFSAVLFEATTLSGHLLVCTMYVVLGHM